MICWIFILAPLSETKRVYLARKPRLHMRSRCGIAKMQDKFDGTYVMDGWALLVCLASPHLEIQEISCLILGMIIT